MTDSYTYWHVGDPPTQWLRRTPGRCDILVDGRWEPIDPAKYGGATDPWAAKIGNGDDVTQVDLKDVPVKS